LSATTTEHPGGETGLVSPPWQLVPLLARPTRPEPIGPRSQARIIWVLIGVGILVRTVRYLLRFPLWDDECALAVHLLDRGYLELLGPLQHGQVCPGGFLWAQAALVRWLGFSEYVLRLPAFACSIASLLLFRHLAGRLLRGFALVMAAGIFAVAYPLVRYAGEAKPYGCDMFFSLLLLCLVVEWWHRGLAPRWLWLLAAVVPVAVFSSYPVIFVGGGVSLAAACLLWTAGDRRGWWAWAAMTLSLLGAVAAVFVLTISPQSASDLGWMQLQWAETFPPLNEPLGLLLWLVDAHTGQMLAYPVGGMNWGSTFTLLCLLVAVSVLCRRRRWSLLVICLAPLALNFVAAALQRYPYGGMVRFQLYLAPVFCLLAGFGLAVLSAWCPTRRLDRAVPSALAALALLAVGGATIARDLAQPAKDQFEAQWRDVSKQLWCELAREGEVICLATDLKRSFSPAVFEHRWGQIFRCNQYIYSRRHAQGKPPAWDRLASDWPLHCVELKSSVLPDDKAARQRWLAEMESRYVLVARRQYPLGACAEEAPLLAEVYTFVPRLSCAAEQPMLARAKRNRPAGY